MDKIILIGAGGHAKSCIDVLECDNQYQIAGLVDSNESTDKKIVGYPVIGVDDDLERLRQKFTYALVTVGQIRSSETRERIFNLLKSLEYSIPVVKSPISYTSQHSEISEGTVIMHGVVVNAGAKIGANCILNSKALVEHNAKISDHCHIATGAIVNGEVEVGEGTFIGSGVVTKQSTSIGKNCFIGAGSVVRKDVPDNRVLKN